MERLAKEVVTIILDEYGSRKLLERLSDPFWFQAFGCVLGYDWHSSGVTTVVTSVLKRAIVPEELGVAVCGGKGKASKKTPSEIEQVGLTFEFSTDNITALQYASRISAKVDNAAIQAGYQLYHHAFIVTEQGKWTVVQQGMCAEDRTARRYHWLSDKVSDFTIEPHNAIVGDVKRESALNMTALESEGCRKASVDISKEPTEKIARMIAPSSLKHQRSLHEWLPSQSETDHGASCSEVLIMPSKINWKTLKRVYEFQPRNYEELLAFNGVGPATVRGLALIAELVYGEKPSWRDPVKYSFAYGGKDGVPYPVNCRVMDESIQLLKQAVEESKVDQKEKIHSLDRLRRFVPENRDNNSC
jgi:uncharacterized protein